MRAWLEDLAPREQLLIGIAVLLTVLVVGWMAIVSPMLAANASAHQRYDASARALDIVVTSLPRAGGSETVAGAQALPPDQLRQVVTSAAQQTGLALTQLRTETSGEVSVVFRDVDPRLVFAFLQLLSVRDGITPASATVNRSGETFVGASFSFRGRVS